MPNEPSKQINKSPLLATFLGTVKTKTDLVVGIDFGTAYSGFAFAYKSNPSSVIYGSQELTQSHDAIKAPTALLQEPDGSWLFGQEAMDAYNDLVERTAYDDHFDKASSFHLYKFFKLNLKDKHKGVDTIMAQSQSGRPHKLIDLISKSLRFLADYALREVKSGFGDALGITEDNITWVITVPAIWNDFGKAFMRKAASRAGLVQDEASDKLLLALEPECASIAMSQEVGKIGLLMEGTTFMVLDCGGGTVDITLHVVANMAPLVLDERAKPSGGAWGGMFVDRQFNVFLTEFFGQDMLGRLNKCFPQALEQVKENFHQLKVNFGNISNSKHANVIDFSPLMVLDIRTKLGLADLETLVQVFNKTKGSLAFDINDGMLMNKIRRDSKLSFTNKQILDFFEPSMKQICGAVTEILDKHNNVETIVLVGGYGASAVLRDRVAKEFQNRAVINPKHSSVHPQAAIAHGAVLYGLYTSVIGTRIAKMTYGVEVNEKWFDGCRFKESDSEWDPELQEMRVSHVFSVLVNRDTNIQPGETFKSSWSYQPLHHNQTNVTFAVYQSELFTPIFTANCSRLGTVTVPCGSKNDTFEVQFTFGAELRVEIIRQDGDRHFTVVDIE